MKLTLQNLLSSQLSKPSGAIGKIVARLMAKANKDMYDFVLSTMGDPGKRILEIGFGGGTHFDKIYNLNNETIIDGIDRSADMLRLAIKNNLKHINNLNLSLFKADSSSIPYDASVFDTVLSLNTIYFWQDPAKDLAEIYRVIASSGRLILGMNSKKIMIKNGYRKSVFSFYDLDEVKQMLKSAGFININTSYKKLEFEDCYSIIAVKP